MLRNEQPGEVPLGHVAGSGWAKARPLGLVLAALLAAFTGVLLLLTGLLLSSALLLAGLLLPSALLLLTRRALPALFLLVALILRNIFVWISHLSYLMLKSNKFHVTMNQLITSYGDRVRSRQIISFIFPICVTARAALAESHINR
jgi:ABC-type enterochelin transport system permease subunit